MQQSVLPDAGLWKGRRVLVTGNTGFKGSWLTIWLKRLGTDVYGLSLPPLSSPSLFDEARLDEIAKTAFVDLRDREAVTAAVAEIEPEVVLHLAAQPVVGRAYEVPTETFDVNITGTVNLLEAIRRVDSVRSVVVVTSDKVYHEAAGRVVFDEASVLGGDEPYGASKAAAEFVAAAYRASYLAPKGVGLATARAGNVIGGGDWTDRRLLPDIVRAWSQNQPLLVRHPSAVRPWQHTLEPLAGYLVLGERLLEDPTSVASAWNFGPAGSDAADVRRVIAVAREAFGGGAVEWGAGAEAFPEADFLAVDSSRARDRLGVRVRWTLEESVSRTVAWYRRHLDGADARALCEEDLDAYVAEVPLPAAATA